MLESTLRSALGAASLDRHTYVPRIAQHAELRDAHFDTRGLEVLEYEFRDMFGEVFDEAEALFCEQRADTFHDHPVVDRVCDLLGLEHGSAGGQGDLEVNFDRLRGDFLVAVEPDPGLQPELADENDVQEWLPGLDSAAF